MTVSAAKVKANRKYDDKAYRKVLVRVPKSIEEQFLAKAGDSMNGYVLGLIKKDLGITDSDDSENTTE